jgi:hypothetical protein
MDLKPPFQRGAWQSFGSTIFSPQQAILTTQLAQAGVAQRGAIWNQNPFPYRNQWEIILRIKMSGRANDGEGLALWLTEQPNELGPVFGSRDMFKGMAIVFDSIDNDKLRNNPSISAHYFDGTQTYDHSDDGLRTQIAGCIADYRNRKNTVAAKVAYNGTHLSVHVDLTETNDYRKCFVEKLIMRNDQPVYLGVSAETIAGQSQETQDVISIEVKGTPDWSRPAPPAVNAANQWNAPPQQQWQSPPVAEAQKPQYQGTPVAQAVPSADVTWKAAESEATAVHEKLDQLMKAAAHTSLESSTAGEVLKEIESNLMRHISGATKAIMARMRKLEPMSSSIGIASTQIDGLAKLIDANKGSVDAGRIDAERRANELDAKLAQVQVDLKQLMDGMEKNSRLTISMIDRRIRDSSFNMSQAVQKSVSPWGFWIYIALFQSLFVAFVIFRHVTNKKLDKLL